MADLLGGFLSAKAIFAESDLASIFGEIAMRYPSPTPTPLKGSYGHPSLCGHLKLLIYCLVDLEIWMLKSGLNYGLVGNSLCGFLSA